MNQLDNSFRQAVASQAALPVLNQPLSNVRELTETVKRFQSAIDSAVRTALDKLRDTNPTNDRGRATIQDELYASLTRAGVLGDSDGVGGITKDDVLVSGVDLASSTVTIEFRLTGSATAAGSAFQFGTGLPGIPLEIDGGGELDVTAAFDYRNLKFGLTDNAFFLDTAAADELTATVAATLRNASMTGVVGFLKVDAAPTPGAAPTRLTANLTLDVRGGGAVQIANPRLAGGADINLTLTGSFTDNPAVTYQIPSIATDFQMHWAFNGGDPRNGRANLGAEPTVNFNNVRVSMGQFLSSMVGPIVEDLQTALKPLQPVLAVLNYRIPGLSDLTEAAGEGPVSLLTLAKAASAIGVLPPNVKLLVEVVNVVSQSRTSSTASRVSEATSGSRSAASTSTSSTTTSAHSARSSSRAAGCGT